jgi:SAM-dependent methyltransferase
MTAPIGQHQIEIERNLAAWKSKPLLQSLYNGFYTRILELVDPRAPGRVVEVGSGIGNIKAHLPNAICTDLFPNPWLDLVCDGYDLPFQKGTLSHLILFDVFHHLQAPEAFLQEARRVLSDSGRLILFEPYISLLSGPVNGLLHHEPVGWRRPIDRRTHLSRPRDYYAAQGNATRLFFRGEIPGWPPGWRVFHARALSSFSYLLSGGYSRRAAYPACCLPSLCWIDDRLSKWPRLFGARCLLGLEPVKG